MSTHLVKPVRELNYSQVTRARDRITRSGPNMDEWDELESYLLEPPDEEEEEDSLEQARHRTAVRVVKALVVVLVLLTITVWALAYAYGLPDPTGGQR